MLITKKPAGLVTLILLLFYDNFQTKVLPLFHIFAVPNDRQVSGRLALVGLLRPSQDHGHGTEVDYENCDRTV